MASFDLMGIPSRAERVEADKKPDEEVRDTSDLQTAQPALRAPRPKSWSPPLPAHRIPVPPPPLPHQQAVNPKPRLAPPVLPPVPDLHRSAHPPLRSQVVPVMKPARTPPPKFAPLPSVIPSQDDRSDSLDADYMALRRGSGVGWPAVAALAVAAIAVAVFGVAELRPDLAADVLDFVRGPSTAQASALGGSMPATSSGATGTPRGAPALRAGGGTTSGANPEPPVVSVWSLPVARSGQPQPPAPVFHGSPPAAAAAAPPQHGLFVPSAAFAFNFNAAPQASPAQNVAAIPNAAPTPVETPAPVQRPAPLAAKAAPAVDDAPPANVAAPPPAAPPPPPAAAPPPPPTPPPPPPKPRFAPGSLEDQIQKAVEAEAAKKK